METKTTPNNNTQNKTTQDKTDKTDKTDNIEICIETDRESLGVIQEALDLYTRLLMGQWGELAEVLLYKGVIDYEKKEETKKSLEKVKTCVYPDLTEGASYGIGNDKTPKESKIAYELRGVIRNELHKAKEDADNSIVDAYPPLELSGKELPRVEIKERAEGKEK